MDFLEKRIYEIDEINNYNYKDSDGKKEKTPKLIKQYDLCQKEYINYLKSYFSITNNKPKYINNVLTILDITSGTGLLALSFVNAIYDKNKQYKIILNDILFAKDNDINIRYVKSNIDLINKKYSNINIELKSQDIKNSNLSDYKLLKDFILIADPSISESNVNSFKSINNFFKNNNILEIFSNASYILFKDSVKLDKKYKKMFEYKKYDKIVERFDLDLITKEDIYLLKIFNKPIDNEIEEIVNYIPNKLANIYFFNGISKLEVGEESNYFYSGYAIDYSSVEYNRINDKNNNIKDLLLSITKDEITMKYAELKEKL